MPRHLTSRRPLGRLSRPRYAVLAALAVVGAPLGLAAAQGATAATAAVGAGSTIQAEAFTAQSGTTTEGTSDTGGGSDVGYVANGDWLQYANVDFGSTPVTQFTARVASGAADGVSGLIEVHLDSLTNPSLGSFALGNTGGWQSWRSVPATISATTGTHTVFLKFVSGQSADFLNLNWLTFPGGPTAATTPTATPTATPTTPTTPTTTPTTPTTTTPGNVISGPGGKCVDVAGDDNAGNGGAVQLWDCQSGAVDQHWTAAAGTLKTLGRCLSVVANATGIGSQLELRDCNGTGGQLWSQQTDGSLQNPQSSRCMDSPSGSTSNGARLQIWDCNGSAAQKFSIVGGTGYTAATGGTGGTGGTTGTCPTYSDTPDFGPNVHIYDHSMSDAAIQASVDSVFNAQKDTLTAQFGNRRDAELFKPSTTPYNVGANLGYYTSIAGLGQNPDDVRINGAVTVDAFNASDAGNATQNFWRSAENLSINTNGGADRWAVAQAAPFRRIHVLGGLNAYPASYGWASGGYISDSKIDGQVATASQQQWYSKDSSFGGWSGSVWNMVFSGVNGAPAQDFTTDPNNVHYTTLATTPVSRDVPYLYLDSAGKYRVFLPSLRTNASGASWDNGSTPGTSVPMSTFYVAHDSDATSTIQTALSNGCNIFFTPGIYHLSQTLNVTKASTVVLGIGMPTLVPDNGVNAMTVADVDGVRLKGFLFDAGTTNSNTLLTVGQAGSSAGHASNPTTIQDVFFRIGGAVAGKATNSLVVNSNDTIIDHIWAWRADHGVSATGWTINTADNGLTVNGNNVLATGLFVEHYEKYEVVWNGQNGRIIFFQNEMPYDVPDQASWMSPAGNGYAVIKVANSVTSFEAWGLGSYCYFNVNPAVNAYHAFESPVSAGVKWHDMASVSLGGKGTITHVINDVGAVAQGDATIPVYLVGFSG